VPSVLYRNAREWFSWPVTATDVDGAAVTLTSVGVAFCQPGTAPGAANTFATATVTAGKAKLLLAGPGAADGSAVVLPLGTWVPWFRVVTGSEVVLRPGPPLVVASSAR
jgi:hypothetical protein